MQSLSQVKKIEKKKNRQDICFLLPEPAFELHRIVSEDRLPSQLQPKTGAKAHRRLPLFPVVKGDCRINRSSSHNSH